MDEIVVVTGLGGMGLAIARRLAVGRRLLLAEIDSARLAFVTAALRDDGHRVDPHAIDVADAGAVRAFARAAAEAGPIRTIVHTAGLSGSMGDARRIFAVDLIGTANVIDAFEPHLQPGTASVMIASVAAGGVTPGAEVEQRMATDPPDRLEALFDEQPAMPPVLAYCLAKRGVQLRVQAAAVRWGALGARINAISPGIIETPMARTEAAHVPQMAIMRELSPIQRSGTPDDIAAAVEFLTGPGAGFITGANLVIDGGGNAAQAFNPRRPSLFTISGQATKPVLKEGVAA